MKSPRVTIVILSFSRLHFLRATLESAKRCIHYPNVQWMVLDNGSTEPGLQEYLDTLTWVDQITRTPMTFAGALNYAVAAAEGEYVLLWPDDVQFILEGNWLADLIEICERHSWVGSVALAALRRNTIRNAVTYRRFADFRTLARELKTRGRHFRRGRTLTSRRGVAIRTLGWTRPGIVASGLPSLTPLRVWRELGPWKTKDQITKDHIDASGGAEWEMGFRHHARGGPMQSAWMMCPVAADILTDPTGTKAKVRGTSRYGRYLPGDADGFYYAIEPESNWQDRWAGPMPVPFEELVKPLLYPLPLDANGALLKNAITMEPVERLPSA
jgi:hypothetical protein